MGPVRSHLPKTYCKGLTHCAMAKLYEDNVLGRAKDDFYKMMMKILNGNKRISQRLLPMEIWCYSPLHKNLLTQGF